VGVVAVRRPQPGGFDEDLESAVAFQAGVAGDLPVELDRAGDDGVEVQRRRAGRPVR
jgi:hypothetical protein